MNETVMINAYIVISIIIAATDILLAVKSFKKNKTTGRFLGFACVGAAIVDISYLISIISDSYMCMATMSSIYFQIYLSSIYSTSHVWNNQSSSNK